MEKVTSILAKKHHSFHHVLPETSLRDALLRMNCENIDYLIVMEADQFLGILSEHEITSKVMCNKKPVESLTIKEVMNTGFPLVAANDTVESCMRLMHHFNVHQLPVFDKFRFCGVISTDDILQEAVYNRAEIFDDRGEPVY